jgi:ubiquinone/menaquinone biosynthesis C-methylase UbiE
VSFDRIAFWYRSLEWIAFGDELQRCRIACLDDIDAPRRALVVGEGDGRFLAEFLRAHPKVEVDCLDASARMLRLARRRIREELAGQDERVNFLHHDLMSWPAPEHRYDLVVTHFVLDCFRETQLAEIVRKLSLAATDDASWLLADFRVPDGGIGRLRAQLWLTVMYRFFRLTTGIQASELIDPTPFMRAAGFALIRDQHFKHGMLKSEMWRRHN